MKCPNCGHIQHAKPPHRPKKYTLDQERKIFEETKTIPRKEITKQRKEIAKKWGCHEQTIINIIKRNKKQ